MELLVKPFVQPFCPDFLHIGGPRAKGKAVQRVDNPLIVFHWRSRGGSDGIMMFDFGFFVAGKQHGSEDQHNEAQQNQWLARSGHRRSRNSSLIRNTNPKPGKSCGKKPFTTKDTKEHRGTLVISSEHRRGENTQDFTKLKGI